MNWMSAFLDGYIQLAHAIVSVAAESYKYTLLAVKNHTRSDSVFRRKEELESFFLSECLHCCPDLTEDILYRKCRRYTILTGKEFLWQYIMIDRKIRSVKLQLDSMIALANTSAMQDHLQSKIDDLTNSLKLIVDNGNLVKMQMINKIQQIENDNRREIFIRKYIKFESIVKISKEMFISRQGIYYHLELGEKEIEKLI